MFAKIRYLILWGMYSVFFCPWQNDAHAVVYVHHSPIVFSWKASTGSVDHYNVYVSIEGRSFVPLAKASTNTCSLDVQDGQSYVVKVDAENALGNRGPLSDPSEEVVVFLHGTQNDTDGDGMPDTWEVQYGLNPFNPADAAGDLDNDGLSNLKEFLAGTLPNNPDTDGDGVSDGAEVRELSANAGKDFYAPVQGPVILDGSESDNSDGGTLLYSWRQTAGPSVELINPDSSMPLFYPAVTGKYGFRLVVSDGVASSDPDTVSVQVVDALMPGDVAPRGNPDGIVNDLDVSLIYQFYLSGLIPTEEELQKIDVAPVKYLGNYGSRQCIRLEPDGTFDYSDLFVFMLIYYGSLEVVGWEIPTP